MGIRISPGYRVATVILPSAQSCLLDLADSKALCDPGYIDEHFILRLLAQQRRAQRRTRGDHGHGVPVMDKLEPRGIRGEK